MHINASSVDNIQRLINLKNYSRLEGIESSEISIDALLELICRGREWSCDQGSFGHRLISQLRRQSQTLDRAFSDFENEKPHSSTDLRVVSYDHTYLPSPRNLGLAWDSFRKRFELSVRSHGFSADKARAIAGAMAEMVENVWNHSGPTDAAPAQGMVAYLVSPGSVTYTVADEGRGLLESLRSGGNAGDLQTNQDALEAAIRYHRSRLPAFERGQGFAKVVRSLADLNGILRFRTGDSVMIVTGNEEHRNYDLRPSPPMRGLQLAVRCSPTGTPVSDNIP